MSDPLGDAVRATFQERLSEPTPPPNMASILRTSRRRTVTRLTTGSLMLAGTLVLAGGLSVELAHRDSGQLADESLDSRTLSQTALDSIGPGSQELVPPVTLKPGPLAPEEYGPLAAGRRRLEGAGVDVQEIRPDGEVWILRLTVQALDPALDESALVDLAMIDSREQPLRDVRGKFGHIRVFSTSRGIDALTSLSRGRVATLNIATGSAESVQRSEMADRAEGLLKALEP